ncbi:envelope stress sensor histidine kinase CpxA [Orbaceae bacterium ac157xtp]
MWLFDRLTIRIFTIFLLTIAFFLFLSIAIPNLDSRNLSYLSNQQMFSGSDLALKIEKELSRVPKDSFRWWMRFIVIMDNYKKADEYLYIITPNEQIITADTTNLEIVRRFSELSDQVEKPAKKIYDLQEIEGPFSIKYSGEVYRLYILKSATNLQSQLANVIFDHPFLLFSLTILLSSPFLFWLSWSLAKPARRLKEAAEHVARGDIQERPELEEFGSSEFKQTGASFNHMIRELKRMQDLQQRLLSDISHELRTPLTRLQLAISLSRRKYGETKETQRCELEAQKLDSMIGELLSLSRQQYTNNEIKEVHVIDTLCHTVLENAEFEAEQLGKTFKVMFMINKEKILCYPKALCSAIENVIRNAFRYSYKNIEVAFTVKDEQLFIAIDDDGQGVNPEEYEKIFRPFYRTSEARDRESGGTGLGLAIVANAITQNHGKVFAEKSHLGGLRVVIILPLYQ